MTLPRETAHPIVHHLVTGHYREGKGYATWRVQGTGDWLLIYTLAGRGRFGHAEGQAVVGPGDMTMLRPGTRHDYGVEARRQQWELLWAHFHPRPHWHEWLDWPEEAPGLMRLALPAGDSRDRIVARFFDAHHLAAGARRHGEALAMNALEETLLWCDTLNPRSEQARIDPRIRQIMDHLCLHLGEKHTLETLAEIGGLSVSRMAHLFRKQVGRTPMQFLEWQRLERARQLLELTPRPIQVIAAESGFDNPFYFTLRFKRLTGLSPRAYRNRQT
ncbi:MAG TPA: helix-turn-helix domain-containing protein [Chthonomonadaceae bacterium]|nr:helix-turn-helix domain-containing protein [Chthonomonadaceae bacterium]